MIAGLMEEMASAGVSLESAATVIGISSRTVQRWRERNIGEDQRRGPKTSPANKLSAKERESVLKVADSPEYRDLSPKQIVPKLADAGTYVASESSFYRILREEGQLAHREKSRPASHKPVEHVATGPCQVWSWDITYLRSALRGSFYYLYLIVDIWSRKIVGWSVEQSESTDLAAALFCRTCAELGINPNGLVLHSDNGGPMKGSTMLATLQRLGVVPSFSRPHVSDDNPYSESLFRTMKYRPSYPSKPFASVEAATQWVAGFVSWYKYVSYCFTSVCSWNREIELTPIRSCGSHLAVDALLEPISEDGIVDVCAPKNPGSVVERVHGVDLATLHGSADGLRRHAEACCRLGQVHPPFSPLPLW
jgi:transposase InsO family protein